MHKDSSGSMGFQFKNGKIIALVRDSSAARNGLLIDHQILEINGKVYNFLFIFFSDKSIINENNLTDNLTILFFRMWLG